MINFIYWFLIGWFIGFIIILGIKILLNPKPKNKKEKCIFCESETGNRKYNKQDFISTTKIISVCKKHKLNHTVLKYCDTVSEINYQYYKLYLDFIFEQRQILKDIDKYHYQHLERLEELDQEFKIKNKIKGEFEKL